MLKAVVVVTRRWAPVDTAVGIVVGLVAVGRLQSCVFTSD